MDLGEQEALEDAQKRGLTVEQGNITEHCFKGIAGMCKDADDLVHYLVTFSTPEESKLYLRPQWVPGQMLDELGTQV